MNNQQYTVPLPWQTAQWQNLVKRRKNGRLPHALLLHGISGLGKNLFVQAYAKYLLCKTPINNETACNECRSCHLIQAGNYAELYLLQPEDQSKIIRIDQVRELTEQLNQTPQLGDYKIAIIAPAEAMPPAAANALLKTLEEPASNSFLFLITSQPGLIPATIRSRCQSIVFKAPAMEIALQWLQQYIPNKNHTSLLALAEGAPLQALALNENKALRNELIAGLDMLVKNRADPVRLSAAQVKQPLNLLLDGLLSIIMDIIRLKHGFPPEAIANRDHTVFIAEIAAAMNSFDLFSYFDKLYKLRVNSASITSLNQQLLLEDLFCTWYAYGRK